MDEDTVIMEFLVVPVKRNLPTTAKDKLESRIAVLEIEVDGPMTDEVLNAAIIKSFGRPQDVRRYLAVPLDEANIVTVKPTVETANQLYDSYRSL